MKRRIYPLAGQALHRAVLGLFFLVAALVVSAGVAAGQEDPYNAGPPGISLSDPSVCPGDSTTVSVTDGVPNESVTVSLAGQDFPLTLDENGNGGRTLGTTGLEPGDYVVSVIATAGTATTPLVIPGADCESEPPTEPEVPALAVTGSDVCVGDTLVATVTGAGSGDLITVSLAGNSATATTGAEGSVQAAVPTSGADAGTHALLATSASGLGASSQVALLPEDDEVCADSDVRGVQVSAPQPGSEQSGTSIGSLARTGATVAIPTALGAGLVAIGVVLVRRARRSPSS